MVASRPGCITKTESTSPPLCRAEPRLVMKPLPGRAHSSRNPPVLPAVCTHNHAFICWSVTTRAVKNRLFGMPGGKCHPQKRTLLLKHLRHKQSLIVVLLQGQALPQSSSNFSSYFLGNGRQINVHSSPVEVLGLRTSDKINLTDFSQESSTLSNQHSHSTVDILKKKA